EQQLNVQAPNMFGSQAQFVVEAADRALGDLASLEKDALRVNPRAVGPVRDAIAQLVAARALASRVVRASEKGQLGRIHLNGLQSTLRHLQTAEQAIAQVGQMYGAPQFG